MFCFWVGKVFKYKFEKKLLKIWKILPNFQNHKMVGGWGGNIATYCPLTPFNIVLFWFKFGLHMLRWLEVDSFKNTHTKYITSSSNSWIVWVWFLKWYVNACEIDNWFETINYMEDLKFIKNSFIFIILTSKIDKV
jgi:hypothetical protein